jgi:hypothetical protein
METYSPPMVSTEISPLDEYTSSQKIKVLVDVLRVVAKDKDLIDKKLFIPEGCQNIGFCEGYYEIGTLLHFLADMMEE